MEFKPDIFSLIDASGIESGTGRPGVSGSVKGAGASDFQIIGMNREAGGSGGKNKVKMLNLFFPHSKVGRRNYFSI